MRRWGYAFQSASLSARVFTPYRCDPDPARRVGGSSPDDLAARRGFNLAHDLAEPARVLEQIRKPPPGAQRSPRVIFGVSLLTTFATAATSFTWP